MSKRLQVLLDDAELKEIQRAAKRQRMTVAEWVRQALRAARRAEPGASVDKKVAVVRACGRYAFPTGEITEMLEEIHRGADQNLPA